MISTNSLTHLTHLFDNFGYRSLKLKDVMHPNVFSCHFEKMKSLFVFFNAQDSFCSMSEKLADKFMLTNEMNFAGIIFSSLLKLKFLSPECIERIVKKALEISRFKSDYIHINARLNDLRRLYVNNPLKRTEHIKVLLEQEKCLSILANNYEEGVKYFHTVSKAPADVERYRKMLAYVRTTLAKLTWVDDPMKARIRLHCARYVLNKADDKNSVKYIDILLKRIHDFCIAQNHKSKFVKNN